MPMFRDSEVTEEELGDEEFPCEECGEYAEYDNECICDNDPAMKFKNALNIINIYLKEYNELLSEGCITAANEEMNKINKEMNNHGI
jgi:hypothetical protein